MPDAAAARKAYDDFFSTWKSADLDLSTLKLARTAYAKLR
jgi:hypothetical protein